jgi:hypothetical protein
MVMSLTAILHSFGFQWTKGNKLELDAERKSLSGAVYIIIITLHQELSIQRSLLSAYAVYLHGSRSWSMVLICYVAGGIVLVGINFGGS